MTARTRSAMRYALTMPTQIIYGIRPTLKGDIKECDNVIWTSLNLISEQIILLSGKAQARSIPIGSIHTSTVRLSMRTLTVLTEPT